ncbi:MAG: universal stress protein [Taibaiella sp.]|jgi:nucleotide-binding universal stress UspA family protein
MKTIIVPTDFSIASVHAAQYAADMALHLHVDLKLVHVLPLPVTIADVPIPYNNHEIGMEDAQRSIDDLKTQLCERVSDNISITTFVLEGTFEVQLATMLKEPDEFLVVMGTTGAGATEALLLGSYTLNAASKLTCPLIIVPPDVYFKEVKKIGFACDMKNVTETVPFKSIKTMVESFNASLEVLYVSKPDENMYPEVLAETKFIQIHLAGLNPALKIATSADISEGLAEFVKKSDIDLLLLIPKERNFVERIFHKSITKNMILHPKVPMMILHEKM